MRLEVIHPLRLKLPDRAISVERGQTVDLPDSQARTLLQKVPTKVRQVPVVGQVVLIMDQVHVPKGSGGGLFEKAGKILQEECLGLILNMVRVAKGDRLTPGMWYWVTYRGKHAWQRRSRILDLEPECETCHSCQWWWSHEQTVHLILCAVCHPPVPDWGKQWRTLAEITAGLTRDDSRFDPVMKALKRCDEAFAQGDYVAFQRGFCEIHAVIEEVRVDRDKGSTCEPM